MGQGAVQNAPSIPVYLTDLSGVALVQAAANSRQLVTELSTEDAAVFAGNGYTVSTSVTAVAAGSYLVTELANPAGSGVNYVMTSRVMADNLANGSTPLEYSRYPTASVISTTPAPTSVTVGNRVSTGAASSGTFRYNMTTTLPTGTPTSGGFIPTGGEEKRIKDIVVIPPSGKLIYAVGGSGGGLAASARIVMTFLFYTVPV